jgi:dihydrodipicolinate synthase/N-acetylneuraminate lyase
VDGIFGSKANLVPRTVRRFMDLCDTGDHRQYGPAYTELMRLHSHVMQWHPAGARWIKMGMKVLGLPGGEGGVRPPYLMPDDDLPRFKDGLLALGIPEIDELIAAADARA